MNPAIQLSFTWSLNTFLLVSFSAVILYVISRVIYHLTISPLSAVPGPWYAAISDFWLTTHVLRLQQCKTVHALFEKYGPVVRVGPNKIAFCDLASMRTVYSVHKFDKSEYYKSLLTFVAMLAPLFLSSELLCDQGMIMTTRTYSGRVQGLFLTLCLA
jgi:hypothetical protein